MISVRRHAHWIKLAVLALLAWFVASRVDLADHLYYPEAEFGEAVPPLELAYDAGEALVLHEGEEVAVEWREGADGRVQAWAPLGGRWVLVDPDLTGAEGPLQLRPGLRTALRQVSVGQLAVALLVYLPVNVILTVRWGLLLRAIGISVGWLATLRLTWIGLFFNMVVPGGAGGDVVKLIEVGSYSDRQSEVLGTIVADRVVGLLVLIALGVTASLLLGGAGVDLALWVAAVGVALLVGGLAYTSGVLRKRIDLRGLLARLPLGSKLMRLDDSVMSLRRAPLALGAVALLSLLAQLVGIAAFLLAARSLSIEGVTFLDMALTVPVALAANAIPISPGGLGLLEVAFQELMFRQGLSTLAAGFMLGVLVRFLMVAASLPGLPLWLASRSRSGKTGGTRAQTHLRLGRER